MWKVEYDEKATRELLKLDKQTARRIKKYLDERIAMDENPRRFGEPLAENLTGLWRYRVGDYRVIAEIQDDVLLVLVLQAGHRRNVYGGH